MSTWKAKITEKGEALLTKLTLGSTMEITRAEIGAGTVDIALLKQQTSVSNVKKTAVIEPVGYPSEGMCALPVTITSEGVASGFSAWQIGIFATDPDEGEVLFFLAQAEDTATTIPSATLNPTYNTQIIFYVEYGDADDVTVNVDPAAAVSQAGMENYIATHVTAESIGLGNVDNTPDNDKYVAFASRAGSADKAKYAMTFRVNGGRTEGTDQWTYDGSVSKVINITPEKIGAADSKDFKMKLFCNLSDIGLSGAVTVAQVCMAMPEYTALFLDNSTSGLSNYVSDAPVAYANLEFKRIGARCTVSAFMVGTNNPRFFFGTWHTESGWSGWYGLVTEPFTNSSQQ